MQKELFNEYREPQKRRKTTSILPKNFAFLSATYEHIVFLGIAVIMLMVLVFSLGVERGKTLILDKVTASENPQPAAEKTDVAEKAQHVEVKEAPRTSPLQKDEPVKKTAASEAGDIRKPAADGKQFTIQAVAYRSKRLAQKELMQLGKKGFEPFIIVGGGYYQICVGEFESQSEAKSALIDVQKNYKGSFIRKR